MRKLNENWLSVAPSSKFLSGSEDPAHPSESPNPPLRLLLGKDAYEWANEKIARMQQDFEAWKDVSQATDFDPVPA